MPDSLLSFPAVSFLRGLTKSTTERLASRKEPSTRGADARAGTEREATPPPREPLPKTTIGLGRASRATIEVVRQGESLPDGLQTAALLFAGGQLQNATMMLQGALDGGPEAESVQSWLALLDLLRKTNHRAEFDETAIRFVMAFERSAPSWDQLGGHDTKSEMPLVGGAIQLPATLAGSEPRALAPLVARVDRKLVSAIAFDASQWANCDEFAATALLNVLSRYRRMGGVIEWNGLARALLVAKRPLNPGKARNQELWLLSLELLQWANEAYEFEELAIQYAITFEVSPPSWEPLRTAQLAGAKGVTEPAQAGANTLARAGDKPQRIIWSGRLSGPSNSEIDQLHSARGKMQRVEVDMQRVLHLDFVCAGAVSNAILRAMASGMQVNVLGASPIIQALLQLTGAPSGVFVNPVR